MAELTVTAIAHNRATFVVKAQDTEFESKFPPYRSESQILPTISEMIRLMNWIP
jgi:hypothetical protein